MATIQQTHWEMDQNVYSYMLWLGMALRIFADRNRAIIVIGMIGKCAMPNYWLELAASKQSKGFDL